MPRERFERLRRAALVSIWLGGGACAHGTCGDAPGPSQGSNFAANGPSSAAPSPASGAALFCGTLARENEAALAALPSGAPLVAAWRRAATCTASRRGAWGLSIASVNSRDGEVWTRWSLRHLRWLPDGSAREDPPFAPETISPTGGVGTERRRPATEPNLEWSETRRVVPLPPTLFDFDGDGDAEIIVVTQIEEVSESGLGNVTRRGRVWSGRDAIAPYPAARDIVIEDVRDIDGDGRPDLLTRDPYAGSATITCGSEDPYPVLGPLLVAHALPGGTFSRGDSVAVDRARRECPTRPATLLRPDAASAGAIDLVASAHDIACARLWGALAEPIVAAVAAGCRRTAGAVCAPCDDPALLERWARLPPPLLIEAAKP